MTSTDTTQSLRAWARGLYTTEAAVEVLVRAFGGRFTQPGWPWIEPGDEPGSYWLDVEELTDDTTGALSGGERRLLAVVASLAGGQRVDLAGALPGLDRDNVALVLAAVAHTAGTHQHSELVVDPATGTAGVVRLASLYPWPDNAEAHS
jgi:hypothetical protein